jgi:ribose transport system substrate-binding protein
MMNISMKKGIRAALALVCAGTLMVGASACGGSGSSSGGNDKVALLVSTLNNPFFVDLRDGAQAEAKKLNIDLQVSDAQNDSATQQNQAQNAQSQGAKAVIINPVDSDAAGPAVAPLLSAKLPVISVDRSVTGEDVNSHIASDNVAGGAQAADQLAKSISEKGKIIILQGTPGAASTRDRGKGFKDEIKKYPGITIAAEQTANFDRSQALDVATNLMQSNPDAVGIYARTTKWRWVRFRPSAPRPVAMSRSSASTAPMTVSRRSRAARWSAPSRSNPRNSARRRSKLRRNSSRARRSRRPNRSK